MIVLVMLIVLGILTGIITKIQLEREKSINIQKGKLSDNQKDDIEEAVNNLKIVNNIEKKWGRKLQTFFYIKQKALRECVRIYDKIKKENLIAFYVKLC